MRGLFSLTLFSIIAGILSSTILIIKLHSLQNEIINLQEQISSTVWVSLENDDSEIEKVTLTYMPFLFNLPV